MEALPLLSRQTLPPAVDSLRINTDDTVRLGRAGEVVEFGFTYLDRQFTASTRVARSGPIPQISANIAPAPYSAEGIGTRRAAIAIVSARQVLAHARLVIAKTKRICCIGKMTVNQPWTPVDPIAAVTRIMLEIQPYLQAPLEVLPTRAQPRR